MHKVKKKVLLDVVFSREGATYVAYSPALDLSTCGRTLEEARKNFAEAANLLTEECRSMGTLPDVLESCGWKMVSPGEWEPPLLIGESEVELSALAVA